VRPQARPASRLKPSRSETFPFAEQVFMYGDVPVVYFDSGRPKKNAPVMLFVHGLGGNLTHFEYLVAPFRKDGWRVCGLDLPGFGVSGKPQREYTMTYLSGAVVALMDHLGIESASLCGHSLGGLVCSVVGLEYPQRADRLVLLSTAGLFKMPLPLQVAARTMMRRGLVAFALERNARRLLDLVFAQSNPRTERFIEQSLTRPDDRFVADLARVMWAARRDLTRYHLLDQVERLRMPVLVIWGGKDRLLPFKEVPAWAARLPDGELEVFEACGHMSLIEEPDRVVARMKAFFARTSAVSRATVSQAS
jgi:pimeloyl-ACP methyl ester carboxylesterase